MSTLERKIGTISFKQGEAVTLDSGVPRTNSIYRLMLRLKLDISIVTAAATAYTEGFWKILKRVEVLKNGGDVVKSIDGPLLARMNQLLYGNTPNYSAVPTGVGANQSMNAFFILDFAMPRAISPIDTLLNAREFRSLDLRVTWGAPADMYSANSANVTINSGSITVHSLEEITGKVRGGMINLVSTSEKEVTATSTDFRMELGRTLPHRGILIAAEVDGNPNGSVINSVELKNGNQIVRQWDWNEIQDTNKTILDIESIPTGYAFIDFCPDGMLTQALKANANEEFYFKFNVTKQAGTNKIKIAPVELQAA